MIDERVSDRSVQYGRKLLRRLRAVLAEHLDPIGGSAFWLERGERLGVRADDVDTLEGLDRLGTMSADDLRGRPLMDFVPRRYHAARHRLVIGQTGGTTGPGTWTALLPDEFHAAFVEPFTRAAHHAGFPEKATWLFVGPSGPHIIGQAARAIARSVGSAEPFSVDFDPRWSRKLPRESTGAQRYLRHVIDQAMSVIDSQPVDALFATPLALLALADAMTAAQRDRVRGVHYGGMAIDADTLRRLQDEAFPGAVHLSGYGNTLLGCCLELGGTSDRALDYFPHGDRLLLEVVDERGAPAERGRVRVTRLDRSMLIVRLLERDCATPVDPPADAPAGFIGPGLRHPHPEAVGAGHRPTGLY